LNEKGLSYNEGNEVQEERLIGKLFVALSNSLHWLCRCIEI